MTDKHIEQKSRTKALEVMVQSDKEETARHLIYTLFDPYAQKSDFIIIIITH